MRERTQRSLAGEQMVSSRLSPRLMPRVADIRTVPEVTLLMRTMIKHMTPGTIDSIVRRNIRKITASTSSCPVRCRHKFTNTDVKGHWLQVAGFSQTIDHAHVMEIAVSRATLVEHMARTVGSRGELLSAVRCCTYSL